MAEQLGVCVVGCGDMGTAHAAAWAACAGARVVAVVDPDEERARVLAAAHAGAMVYADYRRPVRADEVDVVSVCVPAALHAEVTVFALRHGKHVLCEKPLALRPRDVDRMEAAAAKAGRRLAVGFQRRHSARTRLFRELLVEKGVLGRPLMWSVRSSAPVRTVRNKPAMHDLLRGNGGPFVDMACHTFDLWRTILDTEPVAVTARGFTFAEGKPGLDGVGALAADTGVALVEHASGDLGVFSISWGLPPGVEAEGDESILGPLGRVTVAGSGLVVATGADRREYPVPGSADKIPEIAAFARAVRTGEPVRGLASAADGRVALEVSLAVLRSIRTGERVRIGGRRGR